MLLLPLPTLCGCFQELLQCALRADWLSSVDSTVANCLLALVVVEPELFQAFVAELIAAQPSLQLQDRLCRSFSALMSGVALDVTLPNKKLFQSRFEAFLHDVHGFVHVK